MPLATIEIGVQLVTIGCAESKCGMVFAVPVTWERQRRRDHTSFYCPNGHGQHFTAKTEEEELREKLRDVESSRDYHRARSKRLADDNMSLARSRSAMKGQVTRLKNKAVAGECAFCGHSFPDVAAHVADKHPGVSTDADEGDDHGE